MVQKIDKYVNKKASFGLSASGRFFIDMLHGKFVNVTDFLANPVGVLAYLRINQFHSSYRNKKKCRA